MVMVRRRSRLPTSLQEELVKYFVGGTTARSAALLTGVNRHTATLFFRKLREVIAQRLDEEVPKLLGGEMRVISAAGARANGGAAPAARFLAAVRDGMDRAEAAKIGGMDRQTLRDWVHRFNASGPEGLVDKRTGGPKPRLSEEQLAQFAKIVEAGPDREKDGVVRWRRIDLKHVIADRFGVDFHPRYVGKLLKKLGFSHISARPRHPAQDERIVEAFKNVWPAPFARGFVEIGC